MIGGSLEIDYKFSVEYYIEFFKVCWNNDIIVCFVKSIFLDLNVEKIKKK